ncbi:MAG: SDR family oxidoreductase [Chloroflexi bacterium]|nr:SDR family oxidoreductase [Chloroflexota bacterium]
MAGNKVILITGCSSGMGLEAAVALAKKGHKVYATMRDLKKRGDLDRRLAEEGVSAEVLRLDVTEDASIAACVDRINRAEGRLDVLINNSGFGLGGPLEAATIQEIEKMFDTNFLGVVRCIQAVLPVMRRQRSGEIINVSSGIAVIALPFSAAYSASKFAVEGLSEALHEELRGFNIKVKLIEPSIVTTNFGANRLPGARQFDDASYFEGAQRRQQSTGRKGLQSAKEAAITYVAAVEDESGQFRFQTEEALTRRLRSKLVDPFIFTPMPG